MSDESSRSSKRLLDPATRVSEILFGLIMVLTFTGSLSVATSDQEETRTMLIGAIGCNLAWGLVDAIMYLMSSLTERARGLQTLASLQKADPVTGRELIAGAVPPLVASALSEEELERLRQRLSSVSAPPGARLISKEDWLGAAGVFLLVFLSTFPVVVPFMFMDDTWLAMRVSNAIAIVMLFGCGYILGRYAGWHPWLVGLIMVILGTTLSVLTLALGG
jgi:VIT1/CCC1 family predicted Fe2+/Mn2+ transporter